MITFTLPDGKKVEGNQEEFEALKEGWNEYRLNDGTLLRLKVVASEIYRLNQVDPTTGLTNFMVKSQQVMSQTPPK